MNLRPHIAVSKASRFAHPPHALRPALHSRGHFRFAGCLKKAKRGAWLTPEVKRDALLTSAKRGAWLTPEVKRDALLTSAKRDWLTLARGISMLLISLLPAFADPSPAPSRLPASSVSAPTPFMNVLRLGEWATLMALRGVHLLSRTRAIDPFGITIRGPYKGLPPVAEHPAEQANPVNLAAEAAKLPTIEKAVQALPIGGVDVGQREILIGSRSLHEGDLLVLESGGSRFVVWVQSVEERGVTFCDIDLQKHLLKPVGSAPKGLPLAAAPKELPGDPAYGIPDIRHFLNKDAQP